MKYLNDPHGGCIGPQISPCILSTRNQAFAKLLAQLIKLRAHFPDYPIKKIRLIMLVNLHPMLLMSSVCQLELKLNIQ